MKYLAAMLFLGVAVISAVAATGATKSMQTHRSQSFGEALNWMVTGRVKGDMSAADSTKSLRTASTGKFVAQSGDGPAFCDSAICALACSGSPNCCDQTTCYYNNFWLDWSCCGTSGTSNATCCGKMTGGGIAIIVILVLSFVACICGCVYCCCCRRPVPVLVPMAAGSSTYVVMPNGQYQPVVQGQPVAYGQPVPQAYQAGAPGSQAQFPGAQAGYQQQQQYMPPPGVYAAPPNYSATTGGTTYQPMS